MRKRSVWHLVVGPLLGGLTIAPTVLPAQQPGYAQRPPARRPISEATPSTLLQGLPPYDQHPAQQPRYVAPPPWSAAGNVDPHDPAPAPPVAPTAPVRMYFGDDPIPQPPIRMENDSDWPPQQHAPPSTPTVAAEVDWAVPRQYRYLADPAGEQAAGELVERRLRQGLQSRTPPTAEELARWPALQGREQNTELPEPAPAVTERLERAVQNRTAGEPARLEQVNFQAEQRVQQRDWQTNAERMEQAQRRLAERTPTPDATAVAHSRGKPGWLPESPREGVPEEMEGLTRLAAHPPVTGHGRIRPRPGVMPPPVRVDADSEVVQVSAPTGAAAQEAASVEIGPALVDTSAEALAERNSKKLNADESNSGIVRAAEPVRLSSLESTDEPNEPAPAMEVRASLERLPATRRDSGNPTSLERLPQVEGEQVPHAPIQRLPAVE